MESKEVIKDLGIMVDRGMNYEEHLRKVVSKTKQKTAWVLRTFSTREGRFLRIVWRTLIQCHLDYGSILWAPYQTKFKWKLLESPSENSQGEARI